MFGTLARDAIRGWCGDADWDTQDVLQEYPRPAPMLCRELAPHRLERLPADGLQDRRVAWLIEVVMVSVGLRIVDHP